jgi:predicted pyridoxine 5'-phosphate oxidase superfamily flavin-nucleotide-binding protein
MAHDFGSFVFTPVVKALQERFGSRRQYAKLEKAASPDHLGPEESSFIAERDSFYMASVGATGWPYIQHRGGPKGFLKVIDDRTIAFADFSGNKQFISAGNLTTDARVALILMDYPQQARLKILGRAEIPEGEPAQKWIDRVRVPRYKAVIERVFVIHVDAFDWNCPEHITPRYTAEEIQDAVAPIQQRLQQLQEENERLQQQLARAARPGDGGSRHEQAEKTATSTKGESQ